MRCKGCGLNQWEGRQCRRCRRPVVTNADRYALRQAQAIEVVLGERLEAKKKKLRESSALNRAMSLVFTMARKSTKKTQKEFGLSVGAWPGWIHELESLDHVWNPRNIQRASQIIGIRPWVFVDLASALAGQLSVLKEEMGNG